MDRFQTLTMFVAVADAGGFAAAARLLGMSPAAVTRGIAELEQRLEIVLFHRSTRAVSLTDDGASFLPRARAVLEDLAQAERELAGDRAEPRGELVVTAPAHFGRLHVVPVIASLIEQNAALSIRGLFVDRNIRMVEEGIDVAVRVGLLPDTSMKAVRIGAVRQVIAASPTYLRRHGRPVDDNDFLKHRLIATTGPRRLIEWRRGNGRDLAQKNRPRFTVNSVDGMIAAAEAGVGLVSLLNYQVEIPVAAGRLEIVEHVHDLPPAPIHLLFEANRRNSPATRAFIDAMRDYASTRDWG